MAILQKGNIVKVKNSPYEIRNLKKQGFVEVDKVEPKLQPLAENPDDDDVILIPDEAFEVEEKPKKKGKK